jgi:hypothetical protein
VGDRGSRSAVNHPARGIAGVSAWRTFFEVRFLIVEAFAPNQEKGHAMETFFSEGGVVMVPTAVFGFALAVSAVLTLLRPARSWVLSVVLTLLTGTSGVLGTAIGIINTLKYAAHRVEEPASAARFALQGTAESLNNSVLALGIILPSLAVCAVAAFRAPRAVPAPVEK